MNNNTATMIGTVLTAMVVVVQAYIFIMIMNLDAAEQYSQIPLLLGLNVLLYAAVVFVYLRAFIGLRAYYKRTHD